MIRWYHWRNSKQPKCLLQLGIRQIFQIMPHKIVYPKYSVQINISLAKLFLQKRSKRWLLRRQNHQSLSNTLVSRAAQKCFVTCPEEYQNSQVDLHWPTSQTKNVSKEHGESFHFRPLPSLFHNSRQCSSSPFSYRKLLGSPVFQLVNVTGRPVDIQKKVPSSAWSVPDVQKCSWPRPAKEINTNILRTHTVFIVLISYWTVMKLWIQAQQLKMFIN